ncbi:low molecular weight phosphotyrosine protein phosphatase [Hydrogenophaga taeniospiralis CCUG 15921]|uniref:Low molecular weight phosphotyrosine protein phosphatase n=1 Tax=Hydrogenophaga taeniospiralis CCUG 15921 TaxID=1281780 RepID=A0A9X4NWU1_9BURK|nr:low molecular weight phosphotyrosine protein phosphatase [Hydrogenophaga taeniospiralis CCUG 15921]
MPPKKDDRTRLKLLFVCSRNQWRSPTAEQIWRKHPLLQARSGGTSPNARHTVSEDDVHWADVIFVMEQKHKSRLVAGFTRLLADKPIHVLDIPDEYKYMDPELVEMLEQSVGHLLGLK